MGSHIKEHTLSKSSRVVALKDRIFSYELYELLEVCRVAEIMEVPTTKIEKHAWLFHFNFASES